MSVYIKGFPLPNNCCDCPLRLAWCRERIYMVNRPDRCPLVPVPEHGRMIDADALIEDLERQCKAVFRIDAVSPDDYWITRNEAYNEALWKTWVESFGKYLKTRLTIIPADKEGEE